MNQPGSEQQIQDVAQLVRSLDSETAEALLGRFSPDLSQRIRQAVAQLDEVPAARKQEISADFCEVLRGAETAPTTSADLPVHEPPLVSDHADKTNAQPAQPTQPAAPDHLVGGSLDQLAELLRKEHPQTVAAVLTTLIPQRAARLILALPAGQQYEVVRRIAQMDRTDLESVVEIERELQDQLQRADDRQQVAKNGWQAVQSILLSADPMSRQGIMGNLERFDMQLANRLRGHEVDHDDGDAVRSHHYLTAVAFDRLADLDQETLAHVVHLVPHETVIQALAGASHTCLKDLMDKLPAEVAARLRMDLAAIGPLRLGDIHQAQALLVATARQVVNTSALTTRDRLRVSA